MKRWFGAIIATLSMAMIPFVVWADDESLEPVEPSTALVISEIAARICPSNKPDCSSAEGQPLAFIEIYNDSDDDFFLLGWELQYASATANNNYQPGVFSRLAEIPSSVTGRSYLDVSAAVSNMTDGYVRIADKNGLTIDMVGYGRAASGDAPTPSRNNSVQRCESGVGLGSEFRAYNAPTRGYGIACSEPEPDPDPEPLAAQYCHSLRLSEISTNDQWIELYNNSDLIIIPENLVNCVLSVQYGDKLTNGVPTYRSLALGSFSGLPVIDPYGYFLISIGETNLSLAKNVKDRSVLIHDNVSDYIETKYSAQKANTSLAYFSDGWKITYAPTPGVENIYQQWQTCEAGKHINEATGNCIKDVDPPADCAEGQFRNPETGRCKKIDSGNTLADCADGQFRNPLTNRCKKIASDDDLVPCAEGYERNPETNRCRKIVAQTDAQYGIDPIEENFLGSAWALLGAGGLFSVGALVLWQFRPEIMQGLDRLRDALSGLRKH